MKRTRMIAVTVVALSFITCAAWAKVVTSHGDHHGGDSPDTTLLSGTVTDVDKDSISLRINQKIGDHDAGDEVSIQVEDDMIIKVNGKKAKLKDIKAGMKLVMRSEGHDIVIYAKSEKKKK